MSDPVLIAVLGAIGPLLGLAGIIIGVRVRKDVQALHVVVNSRLDELLKERGMRAHAEGVAEGTATPAELAARETTPDG